MRIYGVKLHLDNSPLSSASLNWKITGYLRDGRLPDAEQLFLENPHRQNTTTWNSMMAGYIRAGLVEHAEKMFVEMPHPRDAVSWNTMLAGFRRIGDAEQVHRHFLQMGRVGLRPTEFTLTTAIAAAPHLVLIPQLHSHAIRMAFNLNTFVGTALIGGYADLKDPISLRRAFDEIPIKNAVSWMELVNGYMELGSVAEARQAFQAMPEKNVVAWTTMVNGYINNDNLREARRCFHSMPNKNVVSWTSMIKGYERKGQFVEALELFLKMKRSPDAVVPNQYTYSAVLSACAGCSSLLIGKSVHLSILKSSSSSPMEDVILMSSLVEMYGKCGQVNAAIIVFESIKRKNLVSWNSIIGCYARHGLHGRAAKEFSRMEEVGIRPDHITFVCLLTACAHEGLVEEGERYFKSMESEFGISPEMEHYTCMVDLFGRAGQLEKAESLIKAMPFKPDIRIWGALLGACRLHSSLKHGLFAAGEMSKFERDHHAIYSTLLSVYGDTRAWSKVYELKERMEVVGAKKQKGTSWIESTFQ